MTDSIPLHKREQRLAGLRAHALYLHEQVTLLHTHCTSKGQTHVTAKLDRLLRKLIEISLLSVDCDVEINKKEIVKSEDGKTTEFKQAEEEKEVQPHDITPLSARDVRRVQKRVTYVIQKMAIFREHARRMEYGDPAYDIKQAIAQLQQLTLHTIADTAVVAQITVEVPKHLYLYEKFLVPKRELVDDDTFEENARTVCVARVVKYNAFSEWHPFSDSRIVEHTPFGQAGLFEIGIIHDSCPRVLPVLLESADRLQTTLRILRQHIRLHRMHQIEQLDPSRIQFKFRFMELENSCNAAEETRKVLSCIYAYLCNTDYVCGRSIQELLIDESIHIKEEQQQQEHLFVFE